MTILGTDNNKMFKKITDLFKSTEGEARHNLYKHEIYNLLNSLGDFTPPASMVLEKGREYSDEELLSFNHV